MIEPEEIYNLIYCPLCQSLLVKDEIYVTCPNQIEGDEWHVTFDSISLEIRLEPYSAEYTYSYLHSEIYVMFQGEATTLSSTLGSMEEFFSLCKSYQLALLFK